jgi:shikimate dehydrogenase
MTLDPLLNALGEVASNDLPSALPRRVAFIVGANPSKGARSPKLWNAAFAAAGIEGEMFPLDVAANRLGRLLEILQNDPRIVGVAVAAPHKSELARLLAGRLTVAAGRCGSINLLSRNEADNLVGSNTDGLGAIASLQEVRPDLSDSRILVLGCGGTGRAVIATLVDSVRSSQVTVAVRSSHHRGWLESLGVIVADQWTAGLDFSTFDVVINCTTVGWGEHAEFSPLAESQLRTLPARGTVFDVVYQPDPTVLLRDARALGLATLSGTRMNLLQAVIAFTTANRETGRERVIEAMRAVAQA